MVKLNQIESGVSACIAGIENLQIMATSLQGSVDSYKRQLKVDLARDLIRANTLNYETTPPTGPLILNFDCAAEDIQSYEYIERLKNTFTAANKVVEIYCSGVQI